MTAELVVRVTAVLFALATGLSTEVGWSQSLATTTPVSLSGAGATLPAPLYKKWIAVYRASHPNVAIAYDAVGSGEGIKRFLAEAVDFAGSDEFLSAKDASKVEKRCSDRTEHRRNGCARLQHSRRDSRNQAAP